MSWLICLFKVAWNSMQVQIHRNRSTPAQCVKVVTVTSQRRGDDNAGHGGSTGANQNYQFPLSTNLWQCSYHCDDDFFKKTYMMRYKSDDFSTIMILVALPRIIMMLLGGSRWCFFFNTNDHGHRHDANSAASGGKTDNIQYCQWR